MLGGGWGSWREGILVGGHGLCKGLELRHSLAGCGWPDPHPLVKDKSLNGQGQLGLREVGAASFPVCGLEGIPFTLWASVSTFVLGHREDPEGMYV